jgi:L-cysteine S-thiosulfotransferase
MTSQAPIRAAAVLAASVLGALCALFGDATRASDTAPREIDGRRSGYLYLGPETRALQDDEFLNPGLFAVERGRELWSKPDGAAGLSCASCHTVESMRDVATRYPRYDEARKGLVNLPLLINDMRVQHMKAPAYAYESEELLALDAFVSNQSHGLPLRVEVDGPASPFFAQGQEFYTRRRGQLNLACSHCHDDLAGQKLRGDTISQGQVNGFPIYRLMWRSVASRHRMLEWCNTALRAEPYPLGSPEYLALELYLAWRSRGLPIEAPAVRR